MKQIEATILGQSYMLACPPDGEALLREAVAIVDREMSAIRDAGKVKARERIAVLTALNLAYQRAEQAQVAAQQQRYKQLAAQLTDLATQVAADLATGDLDAVAAQQQSIRSDHLLVLQRRRICLCATRRREFSAKTARQKTKNRKRNRLSGVSRRS